MLGRISRCAFTGVVKTAKAFRGRMIVAIASADESWLHVFGAWWRSDAG
jgi:hypothetical protein